jgi:hypothetical protein
LFLGICIEALAGLVYLLFDLRGYSLIGKHDTSEPSPVRIPSTAIFVKGRKDVTIKNGTIRGFDGGIYFLAKPDDSDISRSGGHLVEDVRFFGTADSITVYGNDNVIRNNQIYPGKDGDNPGTSLMGNREP